MVGAQGRSGKDKAFMRAEFSPDPAQGNGLATDITLTATGGLAAGRFDYVGIADDDAHRVREIAGQIRKRTYDSYIKAVLGHGAFAVTGTPMLGRWARHRSVRHHVNPWMTGPEVEP
jgi:hypothetical protein